MFGYGLTYAVASLSCTVGPFLAVISTTFKQGSIVSGVLAFIAYGAGMAVTVGVAALAVALLGNSVQATCADVSSHWCCPGFLAERRPHRCCRCSATD